MLQRRIPPYQQYDRTTIKEEPMRAPVAPIIDAEQKQGFKLRDLK
jgi:hypothetical protein